MGNDPFLTLPGAVADGTAAQHFGAPLAEQRSLGAGDAVVSLGHHGIVTVSGPDRLSWLHSMTSQQLTGLRPGESVETLLLDQQGHIEQAIRLVDDGERSWLLVDEGQADGLFSYLNRMRFALRVEVANVSDEFAAVLAFDGGSALSALRETGLAVVEWLDPWAAVQAGGVQYSRGEHGGADWNAVQLVLRREDLPKVALLISEGKTQSAGTLALEALEVRAWRPSVSGEVDDRAIPHEFDWLRTAVHLTKGCYRGQETVAKVHNLGHPPRRLVLLHLDGSGGQLPEAGALVYAEGSGPDARPVGRVTRSALHYEWGAIALALLKRSVAEDAALEVALDAPLAPQTAQAAQAPQVAEAPEVPEAHQVPVIGISNNDAHAVRPAAQPADAAPEVTGPGVAVPGSFDPGSERIAATQEVIVPSDAGRTRDIPRLKRL